MAQRPMRILIVEDEVFVAMELETVVADLGQEPLASNRESRLRSLKTVRPRVGRATARTESASGVSLIVSPSPP